MRRYPLVASLVALVVSVFVATGPAQSKRPLSLDDLARLRSVNDPQVSPDGKWVAYTVGTIDAEKDRRDSDIWMVSWDGTQQVQLTATPDTSENMPRWSPDNRFLAFLTSRGDEEQKKKGSQVWLLNRVGGEAQRLTDIKGGVSDFAWSPDSKRLVLTVNDPDPNDEPEKKEGWKRKTRPPIVIDRYHFKQDVEGYLGPLRTHLSIFDLESRKAEILTSGRFDEESPAWSLDGRSIAFVSNRSQNPDRNEDTNIYVVEAKPAAEPRQLTTFSGPDDGRPAWSSDGKFIAYVQGDEVRYSAYMQSKLAVVAAAGGEPRILTAALDRGVSGPFLGARMAGTFCSPSPMTESRISRACRSQGALSKGLRLAVGSFRAPRGAMKFICVLSATADEPPEVYAFENGNLRRLTHQNDALFAEFQLGATEDFTSKSKDGTEVHGLMVKPASYTPGKKYPMLLLILAANGQDEHSFSFERQFFAANGYVAISVNYRAARAAARRIRRRFMRIGEQGSIDLLGGGLCRRHGRGRRQPSGHRRLELWRHSHRLHDRYRWALQSGGQRRQQRVAALDVWLGPVHYAVRQRNGSTVEIEGLVD